MKRDREEQNACTSQKHQHVQRHGKGEGNMTRKQGKERKALSTHSLEQQSHLYYIQSSNIRQIGLNGDVCMNREEKKKGRKIYEKGFPGGTGARKRYACKYKQVNKNTLLS